MLINGDFEGGHYDAGQSLQIPNGWGFDAANNSIPNPISPDPWNQFVEPEVRVLPAMQLPVHEQAIFILDGEHCLKMFKGSGAWLASLTQVLTLSAGVYRFTVKLWPDLVKEYVGASKVWANDPQGRDGLMRFILNNKVYEWQSVTPPTTGAPQSLAHWRTFTREFAADGETELGIELMCPFALANSGFFADGWTLELVSDVPPPSDCRGTPREQYERTVNVLPAGVTLEQAQAVFTEAWQRGRETVTGSYDDAGIGDLDVRRANLYGINPLEQANFTEFYRQWYSGVEVTFKPLPGEPEPPDPEPPSLHTLVTLHMQTNVGWWDQYFKTLADAGIPARWVKFIGGMESSRIVEAATNGQTKTVYRHFVESQRQEQLLDRAATDPYGAANSYLDEFFDSVLQNPVHAVETINEVIEAGNIIKIDKAVKFDTAFAELVYTRSAGRVVPVTLTAPPGNPEHGSEVERLMPAVRATIEAGGSLGPHTYFPANGEHTEGWMETEQFHHHKRPLLSWDATFAQHGLQPRYLFGEAGAVGVQVRDDGRPGVFAPEVGWRTGYCLNGDLQRYINLLLRYQELIEEWNATHGHRCEGYMIFTTGIGIGWHDFLFNEAEIRELAARLLE